MKRFKYLRECQEGDWVYYEVGTLCQVCRANISPTSFGVIRDEYVLRDGYIETWPSRDTIVYPISLHAKVIAEAIHSYYDKMHQKRLINGSKWVQWLSEKFDELMSLDDDATRQDYLRIYDSIEDKIKELEYHKSFLN